MQFSNNDYQEMLANSLRGHLERYLGRKDRDEKRLWAELADLGILGAALPEEVGGTGGSGRELAIISAELGRARCRVPYVPTAALFAIMIDAGGDAEMKADLLPKIVSGAIKGTLAYQERDTRYSFRPISSHARKHDGVWRLKGLKSQVLYGGEADYFLVSALIEGDGETGVFLVPAAAPGVSIRRFDLVDGQPAADIDFDGVVLDLNARLAGGVTLMETGLDWAAVALASESLACMDELLGLTVDYIKLREQFGKPIGKNQALQHRAADMLMHVEKSRGMLVLAAEALANGPDVERRRAVAQAAYIVSRAGRFVGEQAIQLHGGMGITDELAVSHFVKRLFLNDRILGDSEYQLDVLHELELG